MNLYIIYMPHIAAKLVRKGFPIVKTETNKKQPQYKVFFFKNTLEFQLALQEILESKS